jgi:3-methyl-2-oxobutanoate hydroxymethyltransferase
MPEPVKRLTVHDFKAIKQQGVKATSITAYDYPFAKMCDLAGIDLIICGGSVGMVCLGYETTVPVTMEQLLHHLKPVAAAAKRALVVGPIPFGYYQVSDEDAVRSAIQLVKEAGVQSTKVEGAGIMLNRLRAIVKAGIPCMGHLGVTPQYYAMMGGYRAKGREATDAKRILDEALAVQEGGAWSVELECVAAPVAEYITARLDIPTLGTGSGVGCDIQGLILHDVLGMYDPDRHTPKHSKKYVDLWGNAVEALKRFDQEVKTKQFPTKANTFKISDEELQAFFEAVGEPKRFKPQE